MRKTILILTVILSLALVLMSCSKKTTKPEDTPNVLDSNTMVLSGAVLEAIQPWGENDEYMSIPMSAETQGLAVGKIIVGAPTTHFPNGFLRKITEMDTAGDSYAVVTVPASLSEALESGYVAFSQTLTPDRLQSTKAEIPGVELVQGGRGNFVFNLNSVLYDEDNNSNTTNDQVVFSGTADLDLGIGGFIHIRGNQLKDMRFTADEDIEVSAEITGNTSFFGVDQEVLIFSQPFQPIVVFFGAFPLVLTPVLEVNLNLAGNATTSLSFDYSYSNSIKAGLEYKNNAWSTIRTINEDADSNMGNPVAYNISYRTSLKPEISVLFYGIMGPSVAVGAYGEIEVDPAQSTWWKLWAGFFGEADINAVVLDGAFANLGPWELFDTRFLVKQATSPISGTLRGQVKDAVTLQGLAGVNIQTFANNTVVGSGTTDAQGLFQFEVNAGAGYRVTFTRNGYYDVTYNNVNIKIGRAHV